MRTDERHRCTRAIVVCPRRIRRSSFHANLRLGRVRDAAARRRVVGAEHRHAKLAGVAGQRVQAQVLVDHRALFVRPAGSLAQSLGSHASIAARLYRGRVERALSSRVGHRGGANRRRHRIHHFHLAIGTALIHHERDANHARAAWGHACTRRRVHKREVPAQGRRERRKRANRQSRHIIDLDHVVAAAGRPLGAVFSGVIWWDLVAQRRRSRGH